MQELNQPFIDSKVQNLDSLRQSTEDATFAEYLSYVKDPTLKILQATEWMQANNKSVTEAPQVAQVIINNAAAAIALSGTRAPLRQ